MKKLLSLVALATLMSFGPAFAASHAGAPMAAASGTKPAAAAAEPTKQQNKMVDCNKDAKEKTLKGDERKKFMSSCLKGASDAQKAQQSKMKTCNKDAGDKKLKGDDRKKFMSSCLSA